MLLVLHYDCCMLSHRVAQRRSMALDNWVRITPWGGVWRGGGGWPDLRMKLKFRRVVVELGLVEADVNNLRGVL